MNCPSCNTEIHNLKKTLSPWSVLIHIIIAIFIPLIGILINVVCLLCWIASKPDKCPVCGIGLKINTVGGDNDVYVKELVKKGSWD